MPKVLIVDDEPLTVDMLQVFLKMHGYETVGAANGQAGLAMAQIEAPDAMLLDLMLPDVEGYEVCKQLKEHAPTSGLPVLIISARTAQTDIDKAFGAGADGYLTKPIQFPNLLSELNRVLAPRAS